ncbi:MAG: thioredoxin family protein [Patescibacteria group bacterium]
MRIIKFGAVWCKECLVMRPIWEEIEKEILELKTEYYDADENAEILKKYNVKNIPTFIFLDKSDNEILRLEGMQNKEELIEKVKENLSN